MFNLKSRANEEKEKWAVWNENAQILFCAVASGVMLYFSSTFLFDLPLISAPTVQLHFALRHACDLCCRHLIPDLAHTHTRTHL